MRSTWPPMPHVGFAFFCDRLDLEADGTFSAIRVCDVLRLEMPDARDFEVTVQMHGAIGLRAGHVHGRHRIDVVIQDARGVRTKMSQAGQQAPGWTVMFKGGTHSINIRLDFPLVVRHFGQLWFDVLYDDELLTRIPFLVERADVAREPES